MQISAEGLKLHKLTDSGAAYQFYMKTEPRREEWNWFPYLTNVGLTSKDIPEYLTGHNNWESSYVPPYFKNMWKYPKEFSMDALENVTFDRLRVLFSPGTFGGSGSDYLDNSFAYRAHGDVHTGDGKVFRKNSRSRMTQILEAPPSSVNQSSCYKQYTISGLSLEPVTSANVLKFRKWKLTASNLPALPCPPIKWMVRRLNRTSCKHPNLHRL